VSPPEKAGAPAGDRSPKPADNQLRGQAYTESRTEVTPYGVMFDRPLTTTRTCGGELCWCHTGATVTWPYPHEAFMGEMFRQIRFLEVREGVVE
jgi:hypothetical protein